jgi:hypothetical protein
VRPDRSEQKFFGSLFQKRTASLLQLSFHSIIVGGRIASACFAEDGEARAGCYACCPGGEVAGGFGTGADALGEGERDVLVEAVA